MLTFDMSAELLLIATSMACSSVSASATRIPDPDLDAPVATVRVSKQSCSQEVAWGIKVIRPVLDLELSRDIGGQTDPVLM